MKLITTVLIIATTILNFQFAGASESKLIEQYTYPKIRKIIRVNKDSIIGANSRFLSSVGKFDSKVLWEVEIGDPIPDQMWKERFETYNDFIVYTRFSKEGPALFCVNISNGKVVWKRTFDSTRFCSDPVVIDKKIYVVVRKGESNLVNQYDWSGKLIGSKKLSIDRIIKKVDNLFLCFSDKYKLVCYDDLWNQKWLIEGCIPSMVEGNDVIDIGNGQIVYFTHDCGDDTDKIFQISLQDGNKKTLASFEGYIYGLPIYKNGNIYTIINYIDYKNTKNPPVTQNDNGMKLLSLNLKTYEAKTIESKSRMSFCISDNNLFLHDGKLKCLDLSFNPKWECDFPELALVWSDAFYNEYNAFYSVFSGSSNIKKFLLAPTIVQYSLTGGYYKIEQTAKEYQFKSLLLNQTTYISSVDLVLPLNGRVVWNGSNKTIIIDVFIGKTAKYHIEMQINNPTATVNGKKVQIDPKNPKITPIIKDGRTMIPLRFLAENLGCTVKWIAETKTIIVTYQP